MKDKLILDGQLPDSVQDEAKRLLGQIERSTIASELLPATARAEGFVRGMEVVKALRGSDVEGLYLLFDVAATTRMREIGGHALSN
jgi:hypothetical protein